MARYKDEKVIETIQPYLQDGEKIENYAYGVKQPNFWLLVLLIALAVLPGLIAIALLTKEYIVVLTDRRFIILRVKGGKAEVQEVREYDRNALPPVEAKTGGIFTHIKIRDEANPFVAKFHRMGMKENRRHCQEMSIALTGAAA